MSLDYGNPSSLHEMGLVAESAVEVAREQVAVALHKTSRGVVFTSGGTEADNMAIFGVAEKNRRKPGKIITTQVEHPAVMQCINYLEKVGWKIQRLGVDKEGFLDIEEFEQGLDEETVLVSVMLVNNEVGNVFPVDILADRVKQHNRHHEKRVWVHTDGIQGLGKVPMPEKVDMISVSGHKIHGPKGVGALWCCEELALPPFLYGGGQEKGRRSGTENVAAVAGFGWASEKNNRELEDRRNKMLQLKNHLYEGFQNQIQDIKLNGGMDPQKYSPGILNVSFLGTRGEVLLHMLEEKEIFVSTGSACSSHHKGDSPVLKAMGLTQAELDGAIRFSFSESNTLEQMDYVVEQVKVAVEGMRRIMKKRDNL